MRWRAVLLGTLLFGSCVARADTLVYVKGGTASGTVEEVHLTADGVPGIYARSALTGVEVGAEATAVVFLESGARRAGTLVSVRFRGAEGLIAVPAKEIAEIRIEQPAAAAATPPPARSHETPKAAADATSAQAKGLARNLSLRNAAWDRAEALGKEELEALKDRRMAECRKVVQQIESLEKTIERKERQRREAERRWRDSRLGNNNNNNNNRNRNAQDRRKPTFNDGLEDDRKALQQANQQKTQLQHEIDAEKRVISDREKARKQRVEAVYARQKQGLEAGGTLADESMVAAYKAALAEGSADPKGKAARNEQPKKDQARKKQPKKAKQG